MKYQSLIIGAGPIGIELATVFKRSGITYKHLEAGPVGSTITRWPRETRFFSSPEWIAISGIPIQTPGQEIITGSHYLAYLRQVIEIFDLDVCTYEEVTAISGSAGDFRITSRDLHGTTHTYETQTVVLATGDMNSPRRLGIPGEELPHVTHLWEDPHRYFQRRLLIVGGANSAVEAGLRCWRAGARVTMSYRGAALDEKHLISRLYLEIDLLIRNGQIDFLPRTIPIEFAPGLTRLESVDDSSRSDLPTDFVYLATGFEMDQRLYRELGVETRGEEKKPVHDPETMETNAGGVYIAGTAIGGNQRGYKVFITTSHGHCLRIARALMPSAEVSSSWVGNHPSRDYPLSSADVE